MINVNMDWNNYYNEQINKSNNHTLNKVSDFNGNQVGGGRLLNFFGKSIDPFGLTELGRHYWKTNENKKKLKNKKGVVC